MNHWSAQRVTDDPRLEALLRERIDTVGGRELAEYANGLGLFPAGYGPGMDPPIAVAWFPGMGVDDDGVIVWDVDEPEADDDATTGSG